MRVTGEICGCSWEPTPMLRRISLSKCNNGTYILPLLFSSYSGCPIFVSVSTVSTTVCPGGCRLFMWKSYRAKWHYKIDAVYEEVYCFSLGKIICKQYYIYWDKMGFVVWNSTADNLNFYSPELFPGYKILYPVLISDSTDPISPKIR